jgi:phosphoglycolate phosphatase-like HAD superfamily hydrolase
MAKYVVAFDFDGVIIDSARESFLTSAKTYGELTGKHVSGEEMAKAYIVGRGFSLNAESNCTLTRLISENPKINFSNYSQAKFDEEKLKDKAIAEKFAELFRVNRKKQAGTKEWLKIQKPFPHVKNAIEELSKKFPFYVVTTKEKHSVMALFNYYKFSIPEEKIIFDHNAETKEALLEIVAQKENVPLSQIIFFDDAITQLIHAKKAGAIPILAMWGEVRKVFEEEANKIGAKIARSPKDCEKIISSIVEN